MTLLRSAFAALTLSACSADSTLELDVGDVPDSAQARLTAQQQEQFGFNDEGYISERRVYVLAQQAGMRWARVHMLWFYMQDAEGNIDWSRIDGQVERLLSNGFNLLLTFGGPSGYVTEGFPLAYAAFHCMDPATTLYRPENDPHNCGLDIPINRERFVAFVQAVTRRYGDRIKHFSFIGESHNPIFWRSGDPITQGAIPFYEAVKSVDPSVQVVGPSTDVTWELSDLLERERSSPGGRIFDVVDFHSYATQVDQFIPITDAYRGGREVWITEFGEWAFQGDAWSEQQQAERLAYRYDVIKGFMASGQLHKTFLYRWAGEDQMETAVMSYGAVVRPAYYAVKNAICSLDNCGLPTVLSALPDFDGNGQADFADHLQTDGQFWIHLRQPGAYTPQGSSDGHGTTFVGTRVSMDHWTALAGDFTADGIADYADLSLATGELWIHRGRGDGTFEPEPWRHGRVPATEKIAVGHFNNDRYADLAGVNPLTGEVALYISLGAYAGGRVIDTFGAKPGKVGQLRVGRDWQTLVADFDGDGSSDFAERNVTTGHLTAYRTLPDGLISKETVLAEAQTYQDAGGKWLPLVGDFTGDGKADYADFDTASGHFWVHENVNGAFSAIGTNWGEGQAMPLSDDWRLLGMGP